MQIVPPSKLIVEFRYGSPGATQSIRVDLSHITLFPPETAASQASASRASGDGDAGTPEANVATIECGGISEATVKRVIEWYRTCNDLELGGGIIRLPLPVEDLITKIPGDEMRRTLHTYMPIANEYQYERYSVVVSTDDSLSTWWQAWHPRKPNYGGVRMLQPLRFSYVVRLVGMGMIPEPDPTGQSLFHSREAIFLALAELYVFGTKERLLPLADQVFTLFFSELCQFLPLRGRFKDVVPAFQLLLDQTTPEDPIQGVITNWTCFYMRQLADVAEFGVLLGRPKFAAQLMRLVSETEMRPLPEDNHPYCHFESHVDSEDFRAVWSSDGREELPKLTREEATGEQAKQQLDGEISKARGLKEYHRVWQLQFEAAQKHNKLVDVHQDVVEKYNRLAEEHAKVVRENDRLKGEIGEDW